MSTATRTGKLGRYDFKAIEAHWQRYWDENGTFRTLNPGDKGADTSKPKCYILDMFPYPSGAGLHVGHPVGYCATDIIARFKRHRGFNVLHPMGFDAFGLPAEQYAVETNIHPAITTKKNIEMYRRQLKMFGFSYDWEREVATCDPSYYRWTQWMFARMFESWYDETLRWADENGNEIVGKARPISDLVAELEAGRWGVNESLALVRSKDAKRREWAQLSERDRRAVLDKQRLAYMDEIPVNWCPALGTVLANEEVDAEGRSERGGHPVYRRPLKQWMLRITRYSERLLADLEGLDWPEPIKLMQRNWIGRSTGAEVVFPLADHWEIQGDRWAHKSTGDDKPLSLAHYPDAIKVYTTRPDTLFGATYMVLAPEHPLVDRITTDEHRPDVEKYVSAARNRSDMDRTAENKEKTGVFTGAYAINPVNGARIPIWVADYVLMGYGTGAIMAVPGGDERDFAFAVRFDLPIIAVVQPPASWIEERVEDMTRNLDAKTKVEVDRVEQEHPELAAELEKVRQQSSDLPGKTKSVLRGDVGIDKLIEHYVRHPKPWGAAFTGEGTGVQSPIGDATVPGGGCSLNGLPTPEAKKQIVAWLEKQGVGRAAVNYKLRDWLFSRQRYWGEPFPVLHGPDGEIVVEKDGDLPVELPEMEDFSPTSMPENDQAMPQPPLGRASDWVNVRRDGKAWQRDLNTMPQWAGSCWYYLRFIDPKNEKQFCDPAAERYWMPIDLYVGGAEHAVLHLLYARFWHKVLFDLGYLTTREPFGKLFNQGMVQGFAFEDDRGLMVGPEKVEERGEDQFVSKETGKPVTRKIAKMSKSLRNVVNPDEIIAEYGADTFRLYEMYMGPLESSKPWNTRDVPGLHKLCQRIWRLVVDEHSGELSDKLSDEPADEESLRLLHKTIKRVSEDIESIKLNTALAAIFEFVNGMTPKEKRPRSVIEPFVVVLAPFAPHLAEELWKRLGHEGGIAYIAWPDCDEVLARDDMVEVVLQVCGKIKSRMEVPADLEEKALEEAALADERIASAIAGKTVRKVIVVKNRLVNVVAT